MIGALLIGAFSYTSCDVDDEDEDDIETITDEDNNSGSNESGSSTTTPSINGYTADEVTKANTAANAKGMAQVDKDIILYCNLARLDGKRFWTNVASKNIKKSTDCTESLKSDLQEISNYPMMSPDKGLCDAAKAHADDMNKNNFFDHQSSDGTKTFDRIKKYYNGFASNENIAAGNSKAIDIVMQWLVDENLPNDPGHRKAILAKNNIAVGIYTGKHPNWRYCSVMDFATKVLTPMD